MDGVLDALRPLYSKFRLIYVPVLRWLKLFLGVSPARNAPNIANVRPASDSGFSKIPPLSSEDIPPNLPPFDTFVLKGRARSRLSSFFPRYPFATDRGPAATQLLQNDPHNPFGHEPELAHLIDLLVPDDGTFLDVGSNAGYFSIFLATRPNFRGNIHAFEPVASTFARLLGLVNALNCGDFVVCHHLAASDQLGTVRMQVAGLDPGLAHIVDGNIEGEIVQKVALDDFNFRRVDFMKVDVEGHEVEALRGAQHIIQSHQPYIFLESWSSATDPEKVYEPLQFLVDRNYQLYLPAWAQSSGFFHIGTGKNHEMETFALIPFAVKDRVIFPGGSTQPINVFAAPRSKDERLGALYPMMNRRAN